jgi:hypothetical protein
MELVFGAVILILAAAIVLLFAMLGELNSRLPTDQGGAAAQRDSAIFPLDEARLGVEPATWPSELPPIDGADPRTVLVLSTACSTCQDVAHQLDDELGRGEGGDMAVVLSTADRRRAEDFVRRYRLDRLPVYVDEGGAWVGEELGVRMSPTALVMASGRLESALIFQDVSALRAAVAQPKGVS